MEPPLTADAASLITWSLNSYRKTYFFTSRLGLPQPESNKNQRGWTSFEGDLAPSCRALYDSLRDIRKVLLSRLKTKQGVRVAGDTLIAEVTEPLLAEHGATIWSDSPPFSTVIDIWNYPKYLKHNNSSDRERIMLYLYCWIIGQMFRGAGNTPSGGRQVHTRTSRVNNPPDVDDNKDESEVDTESVDTDGLAGVSDDRGFCGTGGTNLENTYLAPVAQMLPNRPNSDATIDRPRRLQRATTKTALEPVSMNGGPAQVPNDSDEDFELYSLPSPASRRIKRRGYSTQDREVLHNKKHKVNVDESADNVDALSSRSDRVLRGETRMEEHGSQSYPSPPAVQQEIPSNRVDIRNFPNVSRTEQTLIETIDTEDIVSDELASTEKTQAENATENSRSEDEDSVQGTEEVVRMGSRSTNAIPEPLRLVVPIRLTPQSKDTEVLRRRLTANLWNVMPPGLERPNLLLLSSTVDLLESLSKSGWFHLRFREVYANDFNSHQIALSQWLDYLKCVLNFYEVTKFRGNLRTLDAFLENMPGESQDASMSTFSHVSVSLCRWRGYEHFAKKVASVISNLVWSQRWWKLRRMEPLILKFTEELWAWCD